MRKSLLILSFYLSIQLQGQDTNLLKVFTLTDDRMATQVIESGRSVQVITKAQISSLPVNDLNELLQHVAGVDFRQRGAFGAQADVSLRGGSFDQTLILVNGIKVSDPQTGHHNMNLGIDLNAIKKIEVVKGPAASRYGLNAFSGVINIISEPTNEEEWSVYSVIGRQASTLDNAPYYAGIDVGSSAQFGSDRSRHLVTGSWLQSSGYRPNTDIDRKQFFYNGITESRFGSFNALAMIVDNAFGASGFYAFPIDSSSTERVKTVQLGLVHTFSIKAFQLRTKIYSRKNTDHYVLFEAFPERYQNWHRTDVEGGELHGSYNHGFGTIGLGAEVRSEAINSTNLGLWRRNNLGVFAEYQWQAIQDRLLVNTGVYWNTSSDFGDQFLPSAELSFEVSNDLSLFANAGRSFRLPTFTDLYYVGPTNLGNPQLKPEESEQVELGMKWSRGVQFAQVSGYLQRATNLIDWVRATEMDPWQPQNYETVNTTGLDVSYEWRLRKNIANSRVAITSLRLAYAYIDMQLNNQESLLSRYSLNNLNHQFTSALALALGENVAWTLTGRYMDRLTYKSYWLVDTRLAYQMKRASCWIEALNIFDTDYIEAANAPMPGRWVRIGFSMQLID